MSAVSIDGQLVAAEAATVSVFDRGLLYGDGLFEVLRTWHGIPIDLDAHLDRLYASAAALELKALDRTGVAAAVQRTIAAAGEGEHRVRIILTRGPGSLTARLGSLGPGRAIVIVEPLPALPAELALAVVDWPLPRRAGAGHKTLAYLDHILARELACAAGADEAVRLSDDGSVVECATSNLFIVKAGAVVTPPVAEGILPGVGSEGISIYKEGRNSEQIAEPTFEQAQAIFFPQYTPLKEALKVLTKGEANARAVTNRYRVRVQPIRKSQQIVLFRRSIPVGVFTSDEKDSFFIQSPCTPIKSDIHEFLRDQ